jgi:probable HAF family extracellular repeat protein
VATRWGLADLDPLDKSDGSPSFDASDISDSGFVVGSSTAESSTGQKAAYAVMWSPTGQITDLNTPACTRLYGDAESVEPMGTATTQSCMPGWSDIRLVSATAVNETGQIAGTAWSCVTQKFHPFILTPIP